MTHKYTHVLVAGTHEYCFAEGKLLCGCDDVKDRGMERES